MKKHRLQSFKRVLLTTLITVFIAGIGVAGFLYWQENFVKPKETQAEEKPQEEKISGKNIVVITSDEGKLFFNYLNLDSEKIIKKEIQLEATLRGGSLIDYSKNPLVQFTEDGKNLVFAEEKENNFSDNKAFFKFIKTDFLGEKQEVLLDSPTSSGFGNFLFKDNKIFYLKSNGADLPQYDLIEYNIETEKEAVLTKNIGDFFQSRLKYSDGKILGLYKQGSKIFESSFNLENKKLDKIFLISYQKTKDFDLEATDVFPSPSFKKFLYKNYNSKEGYSLKMYDLDTKKTSVIVKDKNFSFDKVSWVSEDEATILKNPIFSTSKDEVAKNEIIKINIPSLGIESIVSSTGTLTPLYFNNDVSLYFEDSKLMYLTGSNKKEFKIENLSQFTDILYAGVFDY